MNAISARRRVVRQGLPRVAQVRLAVSALAIVGTALGGAAWAEPLPPLPPPTLPKASASASAVAPPLPAPSVAVAASDDAGAPPAPPEKSDTAAVAVAPPSEGPRCEAGFAARIYRETRKKVVVVERPEGGLGAGFVFHSKKHVLTALHVVETSRYAKVILADGSSMPGEVVAIDAANDLALLELPHEQTEEPLLPRQHVLAGWPVTVIGHPYGTLAERGYEGVLKFSVSQGVVSAVNPGHIQTDALIAPGNSGGPLLACDGRVIGVASQVLADRIGFAVPILHAVYMAGRRRESVFSGLPHADDPSFGFVTHQEKAANYYGVYAGGSLVSGHFAFVSNLGLAFAAKPSGVSELTSFFRARGFLELAMGYRATFFEYSKYTMAITIAAGPLFYLDRGSETEPLLALDPAGCVAGACTPRLTSRSQSYKGGGVLLGPQVRVRFPFVILPLEASYAYQIDVLDVPLSTHRIMVGLPF